LAAAVDLASLGNGNGGVWTTAEAVQCGLSNAQVEHRLATREWQLLRRGVHCDGGIVPDAAMRGWAAVKAAGGPGRSWAAGRTTARLFRLPLIDDDDPATGAAEHVHDEVAVLASRRPTQRPTLHVQRLKLVRGDTLLVDGCPTLTLYRALPGLARTLTREALVCLLDAALHQGLVDQARLAAVVAAESGRNGGALLRRAVGLADGRAESPAETLARLILLPVLPGLVPQVQLFDRGMREVARFDLGDEELKLAVEADGARGHAGGQMVAKDRRRDRATGRYGWTTERCTWWELRREQAELRARVLTTAADLRRRPLEPDSLRRPA
jgi:hypothetical protein